MRVLFTQPNCKYAGFEKAYKSYGYYYFYTTILGAPCVFTQGA